MQQKNKHRNALALIISISEFLKQILPFLGKYLQREHLFQVPPPRPLGCLGSEMESNAELLPSSG